MLKTFESFVIDQGLFFPSKFNINFGLFIIFGRTIVREIVEEENRLCYALKLELKAVKSKLLTIELCQVHMNKLKHP